MALSLTDSMVSGGYSSRGKLPLRQQWQNIFLVMAAEPALAQQWQEIITTTAQLADITPSTELPQTYDTPHKLGIPNAPISRIQTLLSGLAWGLWWGDRQLNNPLSNHQVGTNTAEQSKLEASPNHDSEVPVESLINDAYPSDVINFMCLALTHDPYGEPNQWLEHLKNLWQPDIVSVPDTSVTEVIQELNSISNLLKSVTPITEITEHLHSPWSVALYLVLSNPWQPKLSLQRVNVLENLPALAPLRAEVSLLVQIWLATSGVYHHNFSNISPEIQATTRTTADQWFNFWSGAMVGVKFAPTTLIDID
jgi:hypothetical protein